MITVKVELWPRGSEESKREIGRMYIANVGGDVTRGDYEVAVCRRGTTAVPQPIDPDGPKPTRAGAVRGYPRLAYNMWRLITRALRSSFHEEDNRPPERMGWIDPVNADFERDIEAELEVVKRERDAARADARVLAHAYSTDNRPPPDLVERALAYPVKVG